MSPYQSRILDLLRTIDSPLIDNERLLVLNGHDTLLGMERRPDGRIDYGYVTEKAADVRLATSETAKLRLALMLNAERTVAGWDFLAELAHLDREARELALRALTPIEPT